MKDVTHNECQSDVKLTQGTTRNASRKRTFRATMTRDERLLDLRRGQRRRMNNAHHKKVIQTVQRHTANIEMVKQRVLEQSKHRLSGAALAELVCCVCDCLFDKSRVKGLLVQSNTVLIAAMCARLKPPPNVHEDLLSYYDVSDTVPELRGLLISRAGISVHRGQAVIQVCLSCRSSLTNKALRHPPKFAIANGLYIGQLPPSFSDTTLTENAMINLSQPCHYITVVRGGKHTSLRSHAYFFRADPAPPALLLPREVVSSGIVGVTMVGALTPVQKAATLKKYEVRISRLRDQLNWYKQHNHLYQKLGEQPDWEASMSTLCTRVVLDASWSDTSHTNNGVAADHLAVGPSELDQSTWRHNAPHPAHTAPTGAAEECEQMAVGLISDFAHVDASTGVQQAMERKGVVVHRSSGILSDFDPQFWANAFCDLFPYGRGGLDEPRAVQIGLHEFIRYCLRLSSRRHAQHRPFALVAFDVIARHNALQAVFIKAKLYPKVMRSIASVPREALEEYVTYQQDRLRALTQMRPPRDPPVDDERLKDLYSSISAGLGAFWGSNEERVNDRKEVFSLQLQYAQPTIFFTLSPDSSSTFRIGALAGAVPASVLDNIEASANDCLTFSRARLGQIATSNPYICAKFFDIVMTVFVDVVLNWDDERGCSRKEAGLFGHTQAFYASTESQNSTGSLHAHMLIWIEGMPSTVKAYYDLCAMDAFRTAMIQYVDTLVTSNVPLDMQACVKCKSTELAPVPLQKKAFRKPQTGAERPSTVKCASCGVSFGSSELILAHAEQVERKNGAPSVHDDQVFKHVACSSLLPCEPELSSLDAALVARALAFYQHHHWCHAKSCFKITKRTPRGNVCRMFMPKEPCEHSRWTAQNLMELKREPGNEYVNIYAPVVNAVFKCNHDVKFLSAGEDPEKAYYMMKYATKAQQTLENPWALHLHAYDKAKQRDIDEHEDPIVTGRRISQSMCCNISNPQEVSAPMACLYLIKGSAVYSSHKFVKLNLSSILKAVFEEEQAVEVRLEADSERRQFTPLGVWQDYIYRPSQLEHLTLMTFAATWERRKSSSGLRFGHTHPLHKTHSLYHRGGNTVVVVCHKRLPDTRREDLPTEERLRFYRSVLALFCPFRSQSDLLSRLETFNDWWDVTAPIAARQFVENNLDYYASRDLAKETQDAEVARYCTYQGENDDLNETSFDDSDGDDDLCNEWADCDNDEIAVLPNQSTKYVDMLNKTGSVAELAAVSTIQGEHPSSLLSMPLEQVQECIRVINEAEAEISHQNTEGIMSTYPDHPTRVQILERALEGIQHVPRPSDQHTSEGCDPVAELPHMPPIGAVSTAFGLNAQQHRMFATVGAKLLTSTLVEHKPADQMVAFLGGLPGAGKSRVISALQSLALKWNAPNTIATAAYQGVAAQAANGQTIHKLFGWYVNSKKKWVPTQKQRERFVSSDC